MANWKYRPSEVISISVWWPSINLTNSVMNLKWRPNNAINHLQTLTICSYVPNVFSRPNEIVSDSLNLQTCFPKTKIGKNAYFQTISQKFLIAIFFYPSISHTFFSANWLNNRIEIRTHPKRLKCKTNSSSTPLLRFDYFCCCCCG